VPQNPINDVSEFLQADLKAVRELLEKQDLESRQKEEQALKQAEIDSKAKIEADTLKKESAEAQAVIDEEKKANELLEQAEKEKTDLDFKNNLLNGINGTNEKLDSLHKITAESDGNTDLKDISEKLDKYFKIVEEDRPTEVISQQVVITYGFLIIPMLLVCIGLWKFLYNNFIKIF